MKTARYLAAALVLACSSRLDAQLYFGQNQVQYDRFRWKVIETEHFLVHYYPEEQDAIMDAARMAERGYAKLSRMLNHQFREKKPLILYRSRTDFAQNNVTGDLGRTTSPAIWAKAWGASPKHCDIAFCSPSPATTRASSTC
jgi:hypothetical protein